MCVDEGMARAQACFQEEAVDELACATQFAWREQERPVFLTCTGRLEVSVHSPRRPQGSVCLWVVEVRGSGAHSLHFPPPSWLLVVLSEGMYCDNINENLTVLPCTSGLGWLSWFSI